MKKNNVEQYKINKYIKYRKKQYYQLDKPNIPDMEEKATIRFIIASLSDELESI
jgi:NAD-dependent DNA ligase